MNRARLFEQLKRHEGLELMPYTDSVGKLTIGIGRNLDDVGITEAEAEQLCSNDIDRVEAELKSAFPWWTDLDEPRQEVLANMAFNMGIGGLKKFRKTLEAIQEGRFEDASKEMLDSRWAEQVGDRATELSEQMRTGETI